MPGGVLFHARSQLERMPHKRALRSVMEKPPIGFEFRTIQGKDWIAGKSRALYEHATLRRLNDAPLVVRRVAVFIVAHFAYRPAKGWH
jgi:hypothetical protein